MRYILSITLVKVDTPTPAQMRCHIMHTWNQEGQLIFTQQHDQDRLETLILLLQTVFGATISPCRGLNSMVDIITHDVDTWPSIVQTVVEYVQTATIIIPVITVLW